MTQFDSAIKNQEKIYGEHNEFESIKKMLLESNPYLIAITFFVSILHSIFDFLAFKNGNFDIGGVLKLLFYRYTFLAEPERYEWLIN